MPNRARSITAADVQQIVKIIWRFRTKPTWSKIEEKVAAAGLPFKERGMRNHPEIADAYSKKVETIRKDQDRRKTERKHAGLPSSEGGLRDLVQSLEKRIEQLERQDRINKETIERMLVNAAQYNIPVETLKRPLAPQWKER